MKTKWQILLLALLAAVWFPSLQPFCWAENPSLANLYPKDKLAEMLIRRDQWRPFPVMSDRASWKSIHPSVRERILRQAEDYLTEPIPSLPATLYLQYKRIGNRDNYQGPWLERRMMLNCMVLAECLEAKGRFLDRIADLIWAICEESSWTWPAHVGAQKGGVDLPDTTEPIVALFSAETANTLAWTHYLLQSRLDEISPQIAERIRREIDQRILTPYLRRADFGWMGFTARRDGRRPNNWNPWINSNVMTAALLLEQEPNRRLNLVHKVLRSLDNFLVPYPSDGSCDEGPSYWGHAGASLFDNLELLYNASGGRIDLYHYPFVREIGRFIYRAHIDEDYFVNIGDCSGRFDIDRDLVYRYGLRIEDTAMQALASYGVTPENLLGTETVFRSLGRLLHTVFNASALLAARSDTAPLLRDVWLGNEDLQLMAARDKAGSSEGLYLACWAGHNGQSHNHNDVGNFIVFANGRPFIIDVGKPTYSRQTFSSDRYKIWLMQSAYHNLPEINGCMQQAGRQYAARAVQYEANPDFAQMEMDISPAYPEKARLKQCKRTVRLDRGRNVRLIDSFELVDQLSGISENLITPCEVTEEQPGNIILRDRKTSTAMIVQYDPRRLRSHVERIDIMDSRLQKVWGSVVYCIRLSSLVQANTQNCEVRFAIQ
ncbi:hypothetical protein AMJ85_02020 [candidate division BRC1 bacterium SM23_51]|nr:MAG: hypothetical protein AMJ85_02020 [candidate division BRC1 bacterium SM23_51]